jgi:hypothetical protein
MRRSDVIRSEHTPLRIEPEVGKVREHGVKSQGKVPWDVLEEDQRRRDLGDDSSDVRPEVPRVGFAATVSGDAEWLAGITRRDEIHSAAPRFAVEGRQIVPDRRAIQGRVFHPGHEDGRGEGFPLDVAHTAIGVSECELEPKLEPADSGT